jgi:hypothetical protein
MKRTFRGMPHQRSLQTGLLVESCRLGCKRKKKLKVLLYFNFCAFYASGFEFVYYHLKNDRELHKVV